MLPLPNVDPRRQQFMARTTGHDPRRAGRAEGDAARPARQRGAPQGGGKIGVDGNAERNAAVAFDHRLGLAAPVAIIDEQRGRR
jgi:hypothetical protein